MSDESAKPKRKKAGRPHLNTGREYLTTLVAPNVAQYVRTMALAKGRSLGEVLEGIVHYLLEHKVDVGLEEKTPPWMLRHEAEQKKINKAIRAKKHIENLTK